MNINRNELIIDNVGEMTELIKAELKDVLAKTENGYYIPALEVVENISRHNEVLALLLLTRSAEDDQK